LLNHTTLPLGLSFVGSDGLKVRPFFLARAPTHRSITYGFVRLVLFSKQSFALVSLTL